MAIGTVLASVAVTDYPAAIRWYQRLFGVPPTSQPMDTVAEWRVTDHGAVQVVRSPERAGRSMVTFTVEDLDKQIVELADQLVVLEEVDSGNPNLRLAYTTDPDGNLVTFAEEFLS
jgi:glyoxylase I family protein